MNRFQRHNLPLLCLLIAGCGQSIPPRDAIWLKPDPSTQPGAAIYLMHGWIGLGKSGMQSLTEKLTAAGYSAQLYNENQWRALSKILEESPHRCPLIIIGHSYGADHALDLAAELAKHQIDVDLIITLDPVTPPKVPANVKQCVNIYQSNGVWDTMPWFRGIPLFAADGTTELVNWDVRKNRMDLLEPGTDHFNLSAREKVQDEILSKIRHIVVKD